ncbi:MAG TPA: hypothetical protein VM580_23145 [Labilithrix sp.]|nr:hypothetical protein [Labilithrix sp.]
MNLCQFSRWSIPCGGVALVAATLTGCMAMSDDGENVASTTASALSLGTNEIQLPPHGGAGGSPADISCNPGDVAVGLFGSSQEEQNLAQLDFIARRIITRVGLVCAHLESDGQLTGRYTTVVIGNPVSDYRRSPVPFTLLCPPGFVVGGIEGRAARFLDAIGIRCRDSAGTYNALNIPVQAAAALVQGESQYTQVAGGDGGQPFADSCPNRYVVRHLTVRSGSWVDGAQAYCTEVLVPPPAPPPPADRTFTATSKPGFTKGGGFTFCPTCGH